LDVHIRLLAIWFVKLLNKINNLKLSHYAHCKGKNAINGEKVMFFSG